MLKMRGVLEFGPFSIRADEAVKEAYLLSLATAALNTHNVALTSFEVGEVLAGYADGDLTIEEAAEQLGGAMLESPFDLVAHLIRQREFSLKTFGPGPRTKGVIDHIRKELTEIEADPADIEEWVDVIILAFDGAWRAGWEPQKIVEAIVAKQTKNEGRDWPDWRSADPEKAIEHVRSAE
nr:dATP/dGTP pyrophosphohydrolase domain-containing protein [Methylobacterium sp. ZNC0032]